LVVWLNGRKPFRAGRKVGSEAKQKVGASMSMALLPTFSDMNLATEQLEPACSPDT